MATRIVLKRGFCGDIYRDGESVAATVTRDLTSARWRWLARHLAGREAKALRALRGTPGIPQLLCAERLRLERSYLPGTALHRGPPPPVEYFHSALRLVRRMHCQGVAHNDLAKEANWIHGEASIAGLVDFQLAACFRRRTKLFRTLAYEDLRHLLKHKQHYCPTALTERQRRILATPLWPARFWRSAVKPCYRFVTRRLLGWPERTDAEERERAH